MAYQALLFCPDEKTARTVTQVLAELEFSVDPCTEPFAAVKKLMSQHFDAIVVDCDNEQNATLLFKSARNSTSNQASLAVAIVEGQAGVAKAFRIGANLVLTKPINVEQSKGTLRVARGLLRKGEPGKPAPAASTTISAPTPAVPITPAPAAPAPKPLATKPMPPARPAVPSATGVRPAPVAKPVSTLPPRPVTPAAAAKTVSAPAAEIAPSVVNSFAEVTKAETPAPSFSSLTPSGTTLKRSFTSGAASAPAPAREPQPAPSVPLVPKLEPETPDAVKQAEAPSLAQVVAPEPPAPSFTFGGAATAEPSSGPGKKIFIGLVAAVVIAAAAYAGWNYFQGHRNQSVAKGVPPAAITAKSQPATEPGAQPVTQAASQPQPAAPETSPETTAVADTHGAAADADESAATKPAPPAHPAKSSAKPSPTAAPKDVPAAEVEAPAPLVVKGGSQPHSQPAATPDATAPSMIGMAAPASGEALSNIVAGNESAAQPVLQKMKISQGVAQGLIVKRVPPEYPRSAMAMRIEGAVELAATISKDGDIKDVKVLKGDQQLAHAAVQAVKQWKYKPYLLNGEPVEIQTEITVNFKLPQ
jgi:periplasmic protein TonB